MSLPKVIPVIQPAVLPTEKTRFSPDEKAALRISDAVKAYGLSRSTFYRLFSQKKLRSYRVAGRRLILRSDLEALFVESAS